jgi:hypothetical protein
MSQFSALTGLECSTPRVEVRMAIWGKEIDRLDADEVVEILASRLRREPANPLALGWINFDHPNHVGENMSAKTVRSGCYSPRACRTPGVVSCSPPRGGRR